MHLGVGIIIRNESGHLFFIQEKDSSYPVVRFRACSSLFGGKIEEGETPLAGLKRELLEEIACNGLLEHMDIQKVRDFIIEYEDRTFEFHLFEGILSDDDFLKLSEAEILEGIGKVVGTSALIQQKWVWGLENVIRYYYEKNVLEKII